MSDTTRGRRVRRRITAILAGVVLAPLAAEGAYRLVRTSGLSPTTNPAYVEHDDRLGWRYRPGTRERHASEEFDVAIEIGEHGFRGPPWDLASTSPRVLILGDSFAFGWGVEHADALPARLARLRPQWNVLGAGVSGYGTDQECLLLESLESRIRPDVVVVVWCANDLHECADDSSYGKRKPRFVLATGGLELTGVPVPEPWIERVSHAWRALRKARWERGFAARERDPEAEWTLVLHILRRMREQLGGRPLVLVSDEARLVEFATAEPGIEHVDLRAALGAGAASSHFPLDGHWNASGHARVAAALASALDPLLPR